MLSRGGCRATGAEREEILRLAGRVYIGYPKYFERVTDRRVRVFVIERVLSAGR